MNEYDRNNLNFLLYASDEELNKWLESLSRDDIDYAHSLLTVHKAELIDAAVDALPEMVEALTVLNKYRLK